jgi:hypothetical protein
LPRDTIVAPARAFAAIARTREWLPGGLIVAALAIGGVVLIEPAMTHVLTIQLQKTGKLTPVQLRAMPVTAAKVLVETQLVLQVLSWSLTAMVLTTIARFKGVQMTFGAFFALTVNATIPAEFGFLAQALAVRLHDPTAYHTFAQLELALPDNLAVFAPNGNDDQVGFLANFDIFTLWTLILIAYGFVALAGVRLVTALSVSFGTALVLALLFEFSPA